MLLFVCMTALMAATVVLMVISIQQHRVIDELCALLDAPRTRNMAEMDVLKEESDGQGHQQLV